MSKIFKIMRKNPVLNLMLNELVFLKLWKRNWKARHIRKIRVEQANRVLDSVNPVANHIFFLCVPTHNNMGDQAQRYCIENWIKENYPDHQIIAVSTWPFYDKKFRKRFEKLVKQNDFFVIQSGYCTTSTHADHFVHRYVAKVFINNRILIMPQTVRFLTEHHAKQTGKIYNKHPKLLFLARDRVSFEMAKKFFDKTKVHLYPDIVTTLIGSKHFNKERNGVLLCVRNDGEKFYESDAIQKLQKQFQKRGITCDLSDTNSDLVFEELLPIFEEKLEQILEKFASYKVVITDRYHGTIFSMISNTPVIVIATKDHKVKTGTEWFKGIYDGAYYNAGNLDEALFLAEKILSENIVLNNAEYFKTNYYNKLKLLFDSEVEN
ncbi:polysaccharide pyruvyl transferase family protein [Acetivibrio clariflavus]|uniref:polysaccharide pyruvyl transferase family protein n=1 Tax=Acetivibrio clariflavus TaxID=288965 RepID=UPI0004B10348|nr:polysaccharide pyruvyl transferase family protein [Acetivibrio clariflavus]